MSVMPKASSMCTAIVLVRLLPLSALLLNLAQAFLRCQPSQLWLGMLTCVTANTKSDA